MGFIPVVGEVMDVIGAVTGRNFVTGESLSTTERAIQAGSAIASLLTGGALGVVTDVVGAAGIIRKAGKAKGAGRGVDDAVDKGIENYNRTKESKWREV